MSLPNDVRPAPMPTSGRATVNIPADAGRQVSDRKLSLITNLKETKAATNDVPASDTPKSTISYLITPESAQLSTPQDWTAALPNKPLELTFGLEVEHIFALGNPGPDHKWLLEVDYEDDFECTCPYCVPLPVSKSDKDSECDEAATVFSTTSESRALESLTSRGSTWDDQTTKTPNTSWDDQSAPNRNDTGVRVDGTIIRTKEVEEESSKEPQAPECTLESLFVQGTILRRSGCKITVQRRYNKIWDLTFDTSVREDDSDRVAQFLQDKKNTAQVELEKKDWSVYGHELVSRVLSAPSTVTNFEEFKSSDSMQEVKRYLTAIHGTSTDPYGGFTNETCGLHMHVARVSNEDECNVMLPLPVLQHLAYILVQYEDLISSLHPVERRGVSDDASKYVSSNLMGIRRSAHVCSQHSHIDLANAQQKIFAMNMTSKRLAKLMTATVSEGSGPEQVVCEALRRETDPQSIKNTRYKFVNFARLIKPGCGCGTTIEFRQAPGSVDFDEIAHCAHLVLSLIKAAEKQALLGVPAATPSTGKKPTFSAQQGGKYAPRPKTITDRLNAFFDLLDFDAEPRAYWAHQWSVCNPSPGFVIGTDAAGNETVEISQADCPRCGVEAEQERQKKLYAEACAR